MIHWQTVKEFFGFGGDVVTQPLTEGSTKTQVKTQSAGHDHSPHSPPPRPKPQRQSPEKAKPWLRVIEPVTVRQPQISLKKALQRKAKTNPKNYYKRNGNYYSAEDDSLLEDLMLLYVLSQLFAEGAVPEYNDGNFAANENTFDVNVINEVPEDLLDVDVSSTPVVDVNAAIEPTYTPPEPVRESYSSGYSDSSSSSSYDSGSSDSGGSDD